MELYYHPGEHNENKLTQKDSLLWEKITTEKVVAQAPHHCGDEKHDEERMPLLPRTAANGSEQ